MLGKKNVVSHRLLLVAVMLLGLVAFTACNKDEREDHIIKVIKQVYEGPDQELLKLSTPEVSETTLEDSKFFTYLDSEYSKITTNKCYETLLSNRIPFKYHIYLDDKGMDMKVKDIDIKKFNESNSSYDFSVSVEVKASNSSVETFDITGSAQFDKESNEISFIQFNDKKLEQYVW